MASTYTVNLGIEKIATGEQSGTWGTTTNTNFDIIDQAINGAVAVTLASAGTSGVPNTLAITDGSTSDGRNKFIDFNDGGDLGATAYVQLTPNDAEKIVHIRNSLSGGRTLILFQGTYNASNDFEVPNGKDVVLKFDGGGATATVTQVFEDLLVTAVAATTVDTTNIEVTNLKAKDGTSAGSIADSTGVVTLASSVLTTTDINGGSVDGVTLGTNSAVTEAQIDNININGNTISSTDTNGNVTITPDGTGSVAITKIDVAGGEIDGTAIGANSASTGSFTTLNATGGGSLTGTWTDLGSVTTVDINGGTIDGVTIGGSSAGAGSFTTGQFDTSLNVDGTVTADGLTVAPDANRDLSIASYGTYSMLLSNSTADSGGVVSIRSNGGIVVESTGANVNVLKAAGNGDVSLYEATGTTAKFFWDASAERLGLGTASPLQSIDTTGNILLRTNGSYIAIRNSSGVDAAVLSMTASDITNVGAVFAGSQLALRAGGSEAMRIDSSGRLLVGATSAGSTLTNTIELSGDGTGTSQPSYQIYAYTGSSNNITGYFQFHRSTGSSVGTNTLVANGDRLGMIRWNGANGTDYTPAAEIYAEVDGTSGATDDMPGRIVFATTADGAGSTTERMRIDSSGNLGLGVIPSAWTRKAIQLDGGGTAAYFAAGNGTTVLSSNTYYGSGDKYIGSNYAGYYAINPGNGEHTWATAPSGTAGNAISFTQAMTLDASGNLGIGTSSPESTLHLQAASAGGRGATLTIDNNATSTVGNESQITFLTDAGASVAGIANARIKAINANAGDGRANLTFTTWNGSAEGERMRIDSSGQVGIGTTNPLSLVHAAGSSRDLTSQTGNILITSNDAVAADKGGSLSFGGIYTGSTTTQWAGIAGRKEDGTSGNFGGYLTLHTRANGGALNERARIDSSGNLLVGRTSRLANQVESISSDTVLSVHGVLTSHQSNAGIMQYTGDAFQLRAYGNTAGTGNIQFFVGGGGGSADSEAMRIDSSGNLLVGTTTTGPGAQSGVAIAGGATSSDVYIRHANGTSSGAVYAAFIYNTSQIGSITQNSTTGVLYNTSSDARLKENIADAESASELIDAIQVRQFDWKADGSHQRYGMVAQELLEVAPEAVSQPEDPDDMMGVDYSKLVPMLVKEIQSLRARVHALESK